MSNNKEGMTVEELLKPRYKVIADYPGSDFDIGNVLSKSHNLYEFEIEPGRIRNYSDHMIESYPHLFKRIAWYEDRKPDEMPVWVKHTEHDIFRKVKEWVDDNTGFLCEPHNSFAYTKDFLPITESEYLQYINSKQQP